jgi:peptide/nickel transport system ATP-binding protein
MSTRLSPSTDSLVLNIEGLHIAYDTPAGEIRAVSNVSFRVRQGETVGIVGESGCGKSTIAFGVVNFLGTNGRITDGSIEFQGRELVGCPHRELREIRGNRISMVYQDPMQALNPVLRIGDQLIEVLIVHQRISKDSAWEQSIEMLEKVYMPDPDIVMNRYPHQLSGGQQQRVVIAMAMLNRPALLIMDEPTTALDVTVEAVVLDLVDELKQEFNTGIIYITHNLGVIARVSDHLNVMYAGEFVERGSIREIFANPVHPYTRGLLHCVPRLETSSRMSRLYNIKSRVPSLSERPEDTCIFAPRCQYAQDRCYAGHPEIEEFSSGHDVRCWYGRETKVQPLVQQSAEEAVRAEAGNAGNEPILKAEHLRIYYEQESRSVLSLIGLGKREFIKAVDDITLQIMRGETLGVVGESGCGKSTLAKGIIGLEKISGGGAEFLQFDLSEPLAGRALDLVKDIQMVFQNPDATLNPSFVVGRQIARPLKRFRSVAGNRVRSEVDRLLQAVRLNPNYYSRFPRQLSGGEKQRVAIARALASRPELMICDEPVSALDVSVQAAVLNLLKDIQAETGNTIMFIAHDLSVVRFFAGFIIVMYLGQIAEYGPTESIFTLPYHPYTEALLSAVPIPDPDAQERRIRLSGEVPSSLNPPTGCRFHTRCPRRGALPDGGKVCETQPPPMRELHAGHLIFCHLSAQDLAGLQSEL